MKNVTCLLSDRSRKEKAAYPVPETLKGKNVACLLSDRSRALAQAYVLKRQDDILFLKSKCGAAFSFHKTEKSTYGFLVK